MPTPLVSYAVKNFFRLNRHLPPTPIGWDPSINRLLYNDASPWKFFRWYFSLFVLIPVITGGSCIYVIGWHLLSPRPGLGIAHVFQYGIVFIAAGTLTGTGIVILLTGQNDVLMLNQFLQADEEIHSENVGKMYICRFFLIH